MAKLKSLFASTTVWGTVLMLWLSISPDIKKMTETGFNAANALNLVDNLAAAIIVIIGRYNANSDLFTPKYVPGRDKE